MSAENYSKHAEHAKQSKLCTFECMSSGFLCHPQRADWHMTLLWSQAEDNAFNTLNSVAPLTSSCYQLEKANIEQIVFHRNWPLQYSAWRCRSQMCLSGSMLPHYQKFWHSRCCIVALVGPLYSSWSAFCKLYRLVESSHFARVLLKGSQAQACENWLWNYVGMMIRQICGVRKAYVSATPSLLYNFFWQDLSFERIWYGMTSPTRSFACYTALYHR